MKLLLLFVAIATFGPADATPHPGVDPKADAILRKMGETLAGAKQFTFESHDMSDQTSPTGQKIQVAKTVNVAVRRPDKLAATVEGDQESLRYVFNGKQLGIVNAREKCFALQDMPGNLDQMFDALALKYGITAPLSDLLFSDPYKAMTERVRSGEYLGVHDVLGTKCHHLAFRQDGIDWQIWIEDSDKPLPRKVVITHKELPGYPQFMALLGKWNLDAQIPDEAFAFSPPQDSKRVDLQPLDEGKPDAVAPAGAAK